MKNWLRSWFGIGPSGKRRHTRTLEARPAGRFRPSLETLEDRSLLSTTPLVVASYFDSALYKINPNNGALLETLVAPDSQATLIGPAGMTIGPNGNLFLSSQLNNSIVEYDVNTGEL